MVLTEQPILGSLRGILHAVRANTPRSPFPRDLAASSDIRTGYMDAEPVNRLVITLRGPGCSWVSRGGGCVMCGHHAGTTRGEIPLPEEYLAQFRSEIARYDLSSVRVISLYNSGSMLNPGEVPPEALALILRYIRELAPIRKVVLETRAEYVCRKRVAELRRLLGPGKILAVAIGLETADDLARELCVNKGCSLDEIARAVRSVKGLAETQLYVLLGVPFFTESEAVEDAVHSLECARDLGADEIHIEPLTVQRHTLFERLYRAGICRLPSLYSLYEVLRTVVPEIRPYVSPFLHMPPPEIIPGGCPACTERLIDGLLNRYNIRRDYESLAYPPCACMESWRERLAERDSRPLTERVADALERLTLEAGL
jgi:hypothetical protein